MARAIDVHEELAEAKIGPLHLRLCLAMGLLTFFDGYDTFNPAYVIHYVSGPWGLQPGQAGLLVSSGLLGFLFGALLHGIVADRFGRRVTLLGGLWISSIFTILTAILANSFLSFCVLRLLTGLGLGVLLPLATTYINELAPRRVVNTFALWGVALGWALGGTAAGLVGALATPHLGWQSLYWIGALSFLLIPVLNRHLPESPKFLILRGHKGELTELLTRLRPERANVYAESEFVSEAARATGSPVSALLAPEYRRTTLAIWSAAFLSLFCIFGLSGWIPTVMMQRGESFAASFSFGALMQIMSFIGGLACGHLVDRTGGGRGLLALWWTIGGFAVLALTVLNNPIANFACTAAAGFFVIGAQFVLNNFTAASYETRMRATGVGMELGVGRVGAILGPFVAGALQQLYGGPTAMFVAIGGASFLAACCVLFTRQPQWAAQSAVRPAEAT